jgi:hypothetical protein
MLEDENYSYGAPVVGVHHMGNNFAVKEFYINKGAFGNVHRQGSG